MVTTISDRELLAIEGQDPTGIPDRSGTMPDSGQFMYWRKKDGWIVTGPAWPQEYSRQVEKGMQPLRQKYGTFRDEPKVWDIYHEPYRQLVQRGGAHEFPLEQLLQMGWHRKSPYPNVRFPQLAGRSAEEFDVQCPICRRWFLKAEGHEADLHKHQSVVHKDTAANQQLARILGEATAQQANVTSDKLAEALLVLGRGLEALANRQNEQEERLREVLERQPDKRKGT